MDAIVTIRDLGRLRPGDSGRIAGLAAIALPPEQEQRLLRMGFAEDARIEVRHEGPVGRDPIAVKVDGIIIALRRRDAEAILVEVDPPR